MSGGNGSQAATRVRRSVAAWAVGAAVMRLTLWAPEVCPGLSAAQARAAAVDAGAWLADNQDAAGRYTYEYDRRQGTAGSDYNLVRHAGVTMSLFQLVAAGESASLPAADRGLGWMLHRLRRTPDGTAFATGEQAKLGASALLVVSLVLRRQATGDRSHDDLARAVGRFLAGQQRPDGSMQDLFDLDAGRPVASSSSLYATGEALWALALLHGAFPDDGFDAVAWRTLDYIALDRDDVEPFVPAPWPDQWAAYSLAEMAPWGLSEDHVAYARRLLGRYASMLRWDAQRGTAYGSLTHGPTPRGAGFGTWIEGMASLRRVALIDARLADLAPGAGDLLACGAARLAEDQQPAGPGTPPEVAGAWFTHGVTRMDDQQHAASGLLAAEDVLP